MKKIIESIRLLNFENQIVISTIGALSLFSLTKINFVLLNLPKLSPDLSFEAWILVNIFVPLILNFFIIFLGISFIKRKKPLLLGIIVILSFISIYFWHLQESFFNKF